jgi:hypothetical protein
VANGSRNSPNARFHQTGKLTDDQVRNFLNMRGRDGTRIADNDNRNKIGDVGSRANGSWDKNDSFRKLGNRGVDGDKGSGNDRDRSKWSGNRDGKTDGNKSDGRGNFFADRNKDGKFDGVRDGNDGRNFGNRGDGKFGDKKWDFKGNDNAKRDWNKWSNVWRGKNGNGHDHRDWSGKWRDGDRFDVARNIRSNWWNRHDHDRFPFRGGWWGHNKNWGWGHGWGFWDDYCVRYNRPWFWWSWSTCPVLTDWCGFGWSTPYYWDYGPGEYIYCNNGVVYVNGAWYEPAPVFYQQTVQLLDQAPAVAPDAAAQQEWLPLGVFAVTPDGLNEPEVLAQLAVTKEGTIGGTVMDQKAGKSYNVSGTVDKNSQRAVWSYTNDKNQRVVMETSVNNLSHSESSGLVHYGPNDQKVVELVRLQDPSSNQSPEQIPDPNQGGAQQNVAKPPALTPPQAPPQVP